MKKEILLMTTGIFVGTLLCHGGGAAAAGTVAEPSWLPIFVNGEQVQMEAYNIHGNNFVKLRDIGQTVGFNVYWPSVSAMRRSISRLAASSPCLLNRRLTSFLSAVIGIS